VSKSVIRPEGQERGTQKTKNLLQTGKKHDRKGWVCGTGARRKWKPAGPQRNKGGQQETGQEWVDGNLLLEGDEVRTSG